MKKYKSMKTKYILKILAVLIFTLITTFFLNNKSFVYAEDNLSTIGDIKEDGKITVEDINLLKNYLVNINVLSDAQLKNSDINQDGKVTITDLVKLAQLQDSVEDEELLFGIEEEYVADGDEDGDGLTNDEEKSLGTNIYLADTDSDGLIDYYEINESHTDPLKVDTDGDGIKDGDEITLGLNPLESDSKGDGINDGERTLTYKVNDDELGVNIDITGKGNIASTTIDKLNIKEAENVSNTIYNFNTEGTIQNAIVTIKYKDEELIENGLAEDNISIYYINNETSNLEELNTTIDIENNTATVTLEHFSMYIIGKKALEDFTLSGKYDVIDINNDGKIDGIVMSNSGFDPKVDGFSFNNYADNREPGGHCYGMAVFAMAYYKDKLPMEEDSYKTSHLFESYESDGYDLTNTYFEDGGNLYDFKITSEALRYLLVGKPSDYYSEIKNGVLTIKEKYHNKLNEIGSIFSEKETKNKPYEKRQSAMLNIDSDGFKNTVTKDERQLLESIWYYFLLQYGGDERTSFSTNPDLAFDELQANLQNGTPVVLNIGGHAINAISLIQDYNDINRYKIAVYDNNHPGQIRYINVERSLYNKIDLNYTAWTNKYQYKFTYDIGYGYEEEISLKIHYPQIEETNKIYATLYTDGTLAFTATDKVLDGKTVEKQFGDVSKKKEGLPIWTYYSDKIKYVDIVDKIKPEYVDRWFYGLDDIEEIKNIENLNTSNVTSMEAMFGNCSSLKTLDLSSFDTSNVTDMSSMFAYCSSLKSLDLGSFDTSNVTSMSCMFLCCDDLISLDLSNFDTSNVTDMGNMFCDCKNLSYIDLRGFDTSNVTSMEYMFDDCDNLISLDLSSFNTKKVTYMHRMFSDCDNLNSLNLSGFDTSNVTDMSNMFSWCENLISLDLSSFDTSNVTDMWSMFSLCKNLTTIYVGNKWNTKNANTLGMFYKCGTDEVTKI